MAGLRAIDMALDLARMPALAGRMSAAPLPADILQVICIAAESSEECRTAAQATGRSERVLVDAARFYLQQILFRPESDCYRVLGVSPGASRACARDHMRWLLQWLHPDRNEGWEGVYAKQVLEAWREVSAATPAIKSPRIGARRSYFARSKRLPLIAQPVEQSRKKSNGWMSRGMLRLAAGVITILALFALLVPGSDLNFVFSEISRMAGGCLLDLRCSW